MEEMKKKFKDQLLGAVEKTKLNIHVELRDVRRNLPIQTSLP
jgi:hypothetical protein